MDTTAWLDTVGVPFRDLCLIGLKRQVHAHVYIDDAAHNIANLRAAGRDAIVFDSSANQDVEGPNAKNWAEAEQMIFERFQAWKNAQDALTAQAA